MPELRAEAIVNAPCLVCRRNGPRLQLARRTIGRHEVMICADCAKSLFAVEAVERRILDDAAKKEPIK